MLIMIQGRSWTLQSQKSFCTKIKIWFFKVSMGSSLKDFVQASNHVYNLINNFGFSKVFDETKEPIEML